MRHISHVRDGIAEHLLIIRNGALLTCKIARYGNNISKVLNV